MHATGSQNFFSFSHLIEVLSSIEKNPAYRVTTYAEYKKAQYMGGDFVPFPDFQETPVPAKSAPPAETPRGRKRAHDHLPDNADDFDAEIAGFMASSAKKPKQMDPKWVAVY